MIRFYFFLCCLVLQACGAADQKKNSPGNTSAIGCMSSVTTDEDWFTSGKKAPLFPGMDVLHFTITTSDSLAQQYFNQGLLLSYAFNHAEAARSFFEATRIDSTCAMAFWGYAYVLGPNYNGGMEPDHYARAYAAATKALSLSKKSTKKEQELIEALQQRYAAQAPDDRSELDQQYAASMKTVYDHFPNDPDIAALYAESQMNLHPWDLYEKESKQPKSWTPTLVTLLEQLIKANPKHPGAHHFYIHAMEASATPEKAMASAQLLDTLIPKAGHLVHMPSHIYINTGDYHLGSLSNIRAVEADSVYTTACHAQGVYPLAYYPHNYHFLVATATLEGNAALAWQAAQQLQKHTAKDLLTNPAWATLQHYYTIPYYVAVKLCMWDTILGIAPMNDELVYVNAILHYAKGMAYLGKKQVANAKKELQQLQLLSRDTGLQKLTVWNINTMSDLTAIAIDVLSGAIAYREHHLDEAINLLTNAVAKEDRLNYNEPPDWFFSIRHHLGALLLKAGRLKEAGDVYRKDLTVWKKNCWALAGLHEVLIQQKETVEAGKIKKLLDEASKYADMPIASSSLIFAE